MIRIILFILCFGFAIPTMAQDKPDYQSFGSWPVLHDGRIKTMESFARYVFYKISGETTLNDTSAIEWLTNTTFDPASTISKPFIKINKQTILDLPDRGGKYYSMNDVMVALQPHQELIANLELADPSKLSSSQLELLNVYVAASIYNQIIQSFSAVLPLQGQDDLSYLDGGGVSAQRDLIAEGGRENILLKFIPTDNPSMPMISLWQAVNSDLQTPIISDLENMAVAWNEGDYVTWNDQSNEIGNAVQIENTSSTKLDLEHIYVTAQPMIWVMALYLMSAVILFVKPQWIMGQYIALAGFIIHAIALGARSYILSRPPTGTLYETLLFGAFIIMMVGLGVIYKRRYQTLFLGVCAVASTCLLFISRGFIEGDSLNVLVAVLNTNFWLSTHVTCIIFGYSFCVLASLTAHIYLLKPQDNFRKLMMILAICALLFTSVGTLLGGIWADQSWGRFWGWDPKENGALLIVLWLIWVLHGRLSGHFKLRGFATALALTNIMVALTWFGVNLLGVGLHSYGFISGIAYGLGGFIIAQITVVVGLYFYNWKNVP